MKRRLPRSNRRGVTMVEVLVAAALSVALMALFITLVTTATGSVSTARGLGEVDSRVRSVTNRIRDDLSHVWLGNTRLAAIYTGVGYAPSQGYFMIEENSPACPATEGSSNTNTRQGVDQYGVPVEVDTDDVLAFTMRRLGFGLEDYYTGRVPKEFANYGLALSRYAEVCYFLRPDNRQPTDLSEITPSTVPPANSIPSLPTTYTLYRRQLVVLEDADANRLNNGSYQQAFHDPQDFYQRFDVSASWDPVGLVSEGRARMHFNKISELTDRRFRYGLYSNVAIPGSGTPYATTTRWMPLAAFQVIDTNPANQMHDYGAFGGLGMERWYGRPTQAECTSPGYRLDQLWTGQAVTFATNGSINEFANPSTLNRRRGEDILLTNVISFDVKVFDDDDVYAKVGGGLSPWPRGSTATTGLLPTAPVNLLSTSGTYGVADDFVDLGFRGGPPEAETVWSSTIGTATDLDGVMGLGVKHTPARWRSQGQQGKGLGASGTGFPVSTYDTWSKDIASYPIVGASNTFPPPYARPLKGIQIKIRVLEPNTKIVREATLIHSFQ